MSDEWTQRLELRKSQAAPLIEGALRYLLKAHETRLRDPGEAGYVDTLVIGVSLEYACLHLSGVQGLLGDTAGAGNGNGIGETLGALVPMRDLLKRVYVITEAPGATRDALFVLFDHIVVPEIKRLQEDPFGELRYEEQCRASASHDPDAETP